MKKYTAVQVAKFVITCAMKDNDPVTPLKLQKLLFYLWAEVYHKESTYLFNDLIYAWQFGPVVVTVYNRFCMNGGMPIRDTYDDIGIAKTDESELREILNRYMKYSAGELVELTHKPGMAWDKVYKNGAGDHQPIDFDLIIKNDCQYLPHD